MIFTLQEILEVIEKVTLPYYPLNCEYTHINQYKADLEKAFIKEDTLVGEIT